MSYIVPKKMPMRCFECREISSSTIDGYSCSIAHRSLASEHGINVRSPDRCPRTETTYCVGVIENDCKKVSKTAKEPRD